MDYAKHLHKITLVVMNIQVSLKPIIYIDNSSTQAFTVSTKDYFPPLAILAEHQAMSSYLILQIGIAT